MRRTAWAGIALLAAFACQTTALANPVDYTSIFTVQDAFPDVPANHWAYEALKTLRDAGLLVGYPGGTFQGQRPLSRYEFAVSINAAYQKLKNMISPLGSRIDELDARIKAITLPGDRGAGGATGEVSKQDLAALKSELDTLKAQLSGMAGYQEQLDALKKLSGTFEKDLAALGVDAAQIKKDTELLSQRVTALESRKTGVGIKGDFNSIGVGRHSIDHEQGVDWTGNPEGLDSAGNKVGLFQDLQFASELGLQFSGTYGNGVNFNSDVIVSGILPYNFNSFSTLSPGQRRTAESTDIFINRLNADWKGNVLGNPIRVTMGRFGYALGPYVLKRIDPDPYVDINRYDNGEWGMDGAKVGLDFNNAKVTFLGAKQSNRGDTTSTSDYTMMVGDNRTMFDHGGRPAGVNQGQMAVETEVGADLNVGFGETATFNLGYLALDGQRTALGTKLGSTGFTYNRLGVFGGGAKVHVIDTVTLNGQFSQAQLFENGSSRLNRENFAYDVGLKLFETNNFNFGLGFKEVRPFFTAPGDWGRIGFWQNPTDIRGFTLGGQYRLTDDFDFTAQGEFYRGTGGAKDTQGTVVGLSTDDKISRYQLGVGYRLTERWKVMLGWEGVYWDLQARAAGFDDPNLPPFIGGKPTENYYSLGMDYFMGAKTKMRFLYQVSDYDGKGTSGFNSPGNPSSRAKGGLLVTQFSLEF